MTSISSLASISLRASIETYESLKKEITRIEQSQIDLQELVNTAEKVVSEKFTPALQRVYTCKKGSKTISINLDLVMKSMLACAEECRGQRYVASAIVACTTQKENDEDVVETLAALGTIWLTHLLFVFKTSRDQETQSDGVLYELATPTLHLQEIASHMEDSERIDSFKDDVIVRDGYSCVLTGYKDVSHPALNESDPMIYLQAVHILPRSIGEFNNDHTSDSFINKSAVMTFDILVNFTRIPVTKLHSHLDDPSNGMMLEFNIKASFDRFNWCLKKTETDDVYTLKLYNGARPSRKPENNLIIFRDHSDDFSPGSSRKRKRPIPLPNPDYIAIRATIAEILNMSGAGRFFDELMDKYKDDGGNVLPLRWLELEKIMEEEMLRESVVELSS